MAYAEGTDYSGTGTVVKSGVATTIPKTTLTAAQQKAATLKEAQQQAMIIPETQAAQAAVANNTATFKEAQMQVLSPPPTPEQRWATENAGTPAGYIFGGGLATDMTTQFPNPFYIGGLFDGQKQTADQLANAAMGSGYQSAPGLPADQNSPTWQGYDPNNPQIPPTAQPVQPTGVTPAVATPVVAPAGTAQPTGTSGGTAIKSGSGSIGGGGGTTTSASGGSLPALSANATPTEVAATLDQFKSSQPNEYLENLKTMQFDYDVANDTQFKQAAATMEQTITDMMVGRGGLYSSVYAAKLHFGMTDLMAKFEQIAYDKFVAERDFTFKMANYVSDRQDKEFAQNMQVQNFLQAKAESAFNQQLQLSKFKLDQQSQAFSQKMALRDQQLQEAKFTYQKQAASAEKAQVSVKASLEREYNQLSTSQKTYTEMMAQWNSLGYANEATAQFFHVQPGTHIQYGQTAIGAKYSELNQANYTYQQHVVAYNNGNLALEDFAK